MSAAADVQASFAATLVDEWWRCGVTDAVVAPGSRSTPLLLALAAGQIRVHVVLDERSAGFMAVGLGLGHGRPAVVVTTSGTAAAELHPAVVEAHQAGVPLLAVTADRPAELHGVGAPQTIEQDGLFVGAVRWSAAPGVADPSSAGTWRSLAARSVAETLGNPAGPGPVHVNLAFREPLLGQASMVPGGRGDGAPWHRFQPGRRDPPEALVAAIAARSGSRGLIVAGAGAVDVHPLAAALGWPVLADPPSGARVPGPLTIAAADTLLRVPAIASWRPEFVLRVGQPWASRVLSTWLGGLGPDVEQILVDPYGRWADPERRASQVVGCDLDALSRAVAAAIPLAPATDWSLRWARAESAAQDAIDQVLATHDEVTEPGVARAVVAGAASGSRLFVSSSMPVRDVEWFARPRSGLRVLANRGANGIDGIISTALGVAVTGPVTALLGDLAFLYDAGALCGAAHRAVDCTLVVVDNDGGGIFSFLPQASGVSTEVFERFWGTPQGVDVAAVARAYRIPVAEISAAADVAPAVSNPGGVRMVVARTNRQANVAVHREIEAAVAAAVGECAE